MYRKAKRGITWNCGGCWEDNVEQIIYESADLIYHLLVMLKKFDITPDQVYEELEKREGKTGLRD